MVTNVGALNSATKAQETAGILDPTRTTATDTPLLQLQETEGTGVVNLQADPVKTAMEVAAATTTTPVTAETVEQAAQQVIAKAEATGNMDVKNKVNEIVELAKTNPAEAVAKTTEVVKTEAAKVESVAPAAKVAEAYAKQETVQNEISKQTQQRAEKDEQVREVRQREFTQSLQLSSMAWSTYSAMQRSLNVGSQLAGQQGDVQLFINKLMEAYAHGQGVVRAIQANYSGKTIPSVVASAIFVVQSMNNAIGQQLVKATGLSALDADTRQQIQIKEAEQTAPAPLRSQMAALDGLPVAGGRVGNMSGSGGLIGGELGRRAAGTVA